MNKEQLRDLILRKKSVLCVGLDTDINKIPQFFKDKHEKDDVVFEYNKRIIDAVLPYTIAFKPNLAFYESRGIEGLMSLKKTMDYIDTKGEEVFCIADAKRGDIGNTSGQYAKAFFDPTQSDFNFNAVTVAPYMGSDSVSPFLAFEGKWVIVLALTSNPGADDFQLHTFTDDDKLFEKVLKVSSKWGNSDNTMYVIGATRSEMLKRVREIVPEHFLLIPGVGAQGGNLEEVLNLGWNKFGGLLINASRSIIFASHNEDFDTAALEEAKRMQAIMNSFISSVS